jgi:hypothetical protein
MFIPSLGEIFIIFIVSIIFFKTEDWIKIFQKWKDFKNFIIKFKNNSEAKIIEEINEIEKEILKTKILNEIKSKQNQEGEEFDHQTDEISYKIFEIGSKKYIYGIDGNLHEVFDLKKETNIPEKDKNED